ncbi:MAG TPA: NADH:ubiquinone reductase (Na(+)-transporting) subunit A [Candidatus Omnitrophica bacterium]|nr:NADH:ubiquinone reductase (Na(+)-transporting) subunit A [Candidatus Omnitrophota bacterium]HCI45485.1 NADH:ubiquinone reductase (Na(+)-transporting) subunit A [Candidatus Omnitrophota bacterium]
MATFQIKQGRDIKLKGAAPKEIVTLSLPRQVAVVPSDFKGIKASLCVKVNDAVKVGTPLFEDKHCPEIRIVSPVSGRVAAIDRGEKRFLEDIVVESDGRDEAVAFRKFSASEISGLSKEDVEKTLLQSGLWPVLRQRPFSKVAHPHEPPKSIFVHAMNTEPLAPDVDFILQGKEEQFQAGLNVLRRLTKGKVYLCAKHGSRSKALTQARDVETHYFAGPHPAGNVSTHIHYLDPIHKGDHVWYVEAQDVARAGSLFLEGVYSPERVVAVTGEGAGRKFYAKTIVGAPVSLLLKGSGLEGMRCVSGSVLAGREVGKDGYLSFYDSQLTVIPAGGKRTFLGWLSPGSDKYTFSRTFVSSFLPPRKEVSLTTDKHGSDRAIVLNHIYDPLVPLDIMVYFLLKAVISEDIEEAERLGILECDEEDFALCSFACPSKTDVGGIIREGLELIEREG